MQEINFKESVRCDTHAGNQLKESVRCNTRAVEHLKEGVTTPTEAVNKSSSLPLRLPRPLGTVLESGISMTAVWD